MAGRRFIGIAVFVWLISYTVQPTEETDARMEMPPLLTFSESVPEEIRARSFDILENEFWTIGSNALPDAKIDIDELSKKIEITDAVFLIHGSMYDPRDPILGNPHLTLFVALRSLIRDTALPFLGIGWNSVSFTPRNLLRAWTNGHTTWYGLTTQHANEATAKLRALLANRRSTYSLVCHSVGCDIAWNAIAKAEKPPNRILMLSPDTDYGALQAWALDRRVKVLHVTAAKDAILPLSRFATRNRGFTPKKGQDLYRIHTVDVDRYLPNISRLSFTYTNPRRFGDHMAVTEIQQLSTLYRAFLEGY